jgi:sec-independent protein translocase protein TatA
MFLQPGLEPVMILVVVVVFLLFGSKKIPDLARSFGKARGEFKKGQEETDAELKKPSEREKLEQAAESFGIDTEGKSDDELRDAIKKATDKK